MRLRKNASFILRGYPIGDEIGGGHTGAIKEGAMIRGEEPRMNAKRIPFLVTCTSADQVATKTQIRNAKSVRHIPAFPYIKSPA